MLASEIKEAGERQRQQGKVATQAKQNYWQVVSCFSCMLGNKIDTSPEKDNDDVGETKQMIVEGTMLYLYALNIIVMLVESENDKLDYLG